MDISELKRDVEARLQSQRADPGMMPASQSGGLVRGGEFGPERASSMGPGLMLAGIGVIGLFMGSLLFRKAPDPVGSDLGYQLLARQQEANEKLMRSQQQLAETMIEKAKPTNTTVFCIGSRICPGVDSGAAIAGSLPDGQEQPTYEQLAPQTIAASSISDVDQSWINHYNNLKRFQPRRYQDDWNTCSRDWSAYNSQTNCVVLGKIINGVYR